MNEFLSEFKFTSVPPPPPLTLFLFCFVPRKVGNKLLLPCGDFRKEKPPLDGGGRLSPMPWEVGMCVFGKTENIWWRVSERIYYVLHVCIASQLNEIPSEFEKKWIQSEILNGFLSEFGKKRIQRKWTNVLVSSNLLLYPPPPPLTVMFCLECGLNQTNRNSARPTTIRTLLRTEHEGGWHRHLTPWQLRTQEATNVQWLSITMVVHTSF